MPNRKKTKRPGSVAVKEMVTVAFAEDMELAKQYKKLLHENDIPAGIRSQHDPALSYQGIAVVVPEECLDEAHVIIELHGNMGDFYDIAFHEDEYGDSRDDVFDDDNF